MISTVRYAEFLTNRPNVAFLRRFATPSLEINCNHKFIYPACRQLPAQRHGARSDLRPAGIFFSQQQHEWPIDFSNVVHIFICLALGWLLGLDFAIANNNSNQPAKEIHISN
jgi:hypothetical protein